MSPVTLLIVGIVLIACIAGHAVANELDQLATKADSLAGQAVSPVKSGGER